MFRTQHIVRDILIYLCYGSGTFKCKQTRIIPIIHKKLQTGLHRVTCEDKISKYYKDFLEYIKSTEGSKSFLDDEGRGQAPEEYLRLFEVGLRKFGIHDKFAFGSNCMVSKKNWHSVPIWKKRESYVAVCRVIFECPEYMQYKVFRWSDFILRRKLTQTFDRRHAQYTTGEKTLSIPDPESWSSEPPKKKRRRRTQTVDLSQQNEEEEESATHIAEWDSEEGEFVTK